MKKSGGAIEVACNEMLGLLRFVGPGVVIPRIDKVMNIGKEASCEVDGGEIMQYILIGGFIPT